MAWYIVCYHLLFSCWFLSPWYNRTGWLGIKHQVAYCHLLCLVQNAGVFVCINHLSRSLFTRAAHKCCAGNVYTVIYSFNPLFEMCINLYPALKAAWLVWMWRMLGNDFLFWQIEQGVGLIGWTVRLFWQIEQGVGLMGWTVRLFWHLEQGVGLIGWNVRLFWQMEQGVGLIGWNVRLFWQIEQGVGLMGWTVLLFWQIEQGVSLMGWTALLEFSLSGSPFNFLFVLSITVMARDRIFHHSAFSSITVQKHWAWDS